jgi:hypothetical protein
MNEHQKRSLPVPVRRSCPGKPGADNEPKSGLQTREVRAMDEDEDGDDQIARIDSIIGESIDRGFDSAVEVFFEHLKRSLQLPVEVTGREDFRWEEYYVIGPGSKKEHEKLRKTQPSYLDRYLLMQIELGAYSEWMMFRGDDIGAHVRRRSDRKEFTLGLAELETVEEDNPNHQLLDDFAVFVVNYR